MTFSKVVAVLGRSYFVKFIPYTEKKYQYGDFN